MPDLPKLPKEKTTVAKKFENFELGDNERELIHKMGEENLDYCLLLLLKRRFPDYNFDYFEKEEKLYVKTGEMKVEFDFSKEYFEPIYNEVEETFESWILKMVKIHNAVLKTRLS